MKVRWGARWLIAMTVMACASALAATPAFAVFPGAKGRLMVNGTLYAPPNTTPVVDYPMGTVRFSADAQHVIGQSFQGGEDVIDMADADGSNFHQFTSPPAGDGDSEASWSPDGKQIVFVRRPAESCGDNQTCIHYELMLADVATGATTVLIPPSSNYIQTPEFSPDGSKIVAFLGASNGAALIDPKTGAQTPISHNLAGVWSIRFSPDGKYLVSSASPLVGPTGSARITVADLSGKVLVDFYIQQQNATVDPTFTPDGQAITFTDCRPGCGVWSRTLPELSSEPNPPAPAYTEDLSTPQGDTMASLDWEPLVDEPIISEGPSGDVNTSSAEFSFAIPSQETGHYQCQLDGGGWEECTSPEKYTVPDGQHEFDVRFYRDGDDPNDAPVTKRQWTSDTTPPDALIDQAPSGTVSDHTATIVFHSSEADGATFLCSIDGGAELSCSSPMTLTGLATGEHTFAVKAIDKVGNVQSSASTATWDVEDNGSGGSGGGGGGGGGGSGSTGGAGSVNAGGTLPATGSCPSGKADKVAIGALVAIGRGGTCWTRTKESGGTIRWSATGPVTINGVQVTPGGGGDVEVLQALSSYTLVLGADSSLGFDWFSWTLPIRVVLPLGAIADVSRFNLPLPSRAFEIAGQEVTQKPAFTLSSSDGGSTKVGVVLEAPDIFSGVEGEGADAGEAAAEQAKTKGLQFSYDLTASNAKGVVFGAQAKLKRAYMFGKVELTNVGLGLSNPPLAFEGFGTLQLPGTEPGVKGQGFTLDVGLSKDAPGPFPLVSKLSLQASNLGIPLGETGFFLQRLGAGFTACRGSDGHPSGTISGNAGISFGPHLKIGDYFDGEPVSLDGTVTLKLCSPETLTVSGSGKVIGIPLGDASATYDFDKAHTSLSGQLDLSIGGFGVLAKITDSYFDEPSNTFNLEGTGQVRLPGFTGGVFDGEADTVVSSTGFAACFGALGHRIGIGQAWGGDLQKFGDSCDVGPYRGGVTHGARTAAAGQRFAVPHGRNLEVIAARGASGAPKIVLSGPGGQTVSTPAGPEGLHTRTAIITQDPIGKTTYVVLLDPAPGTWTITPAAGTPAPADVRVADGLPPVSVHASVAPAGPRRTLTWKLTPQPGQRVTFLERSATSSRRLITTSRARGTLRFTPRPGAVRRTIVAVVTEHGLPRAMLTLARYRAPRARPLHRVSGLRRTATTIRWTAQAAATSYSLMLDGVTGPSWTTTVRRASVTIPASMRKGAVSITIAPVGPGLGGGPVITRTLTAPAKSKR